MNKNLIIIGFIMTFVLGFILGFKVGKIFLLFMYTINLSLITIGVIAIIGVIGYLMFKFRNK